MNFPRKYDILLLHENRENHIFTGEQRELAEIIGLDAYKKLIKNYGGNQLYIQQAASVMKGIRDKEINEKFNGGNYKELSREYGISEMTVRVIVAVKRRQLRSEPVDGQLGFFD